MAIRCTYVTKVSVSGASKPLQEKTHPSRDAADAYLDKQRAFAKRQGWGGLTFEVEENCKKVKR